MFPFFFPFNSMPAAQSPYQASRTPGQLYYRDHLLDRSRTPRQYLAEFPELRSYLPMLERFGVADTPLQKLCEARGLQSVQNLIDRTAP